MIETVAEFFERCQRLQDEWDKEDNPVPSWGVRSPNIFCPCCGADVSIKDAVYLWKLSSKIKGGFVTCCEECLYVGGEENGDYLTDNVLALKALV